MAHRVLRLVARLAALVAVAAAVLFLAFLAWRIPGEREEDRLFAARVRRDDGPHVRWLDDRTVRISSFRFDAARRTYERREVTASCDSAGAVVAAIDPNAWVDCGPPSIEPVAVATAPAVAAVSDVHGHYHYLAALLQRAGVVDAGLDWSFGANHLVIAGDILDKGPEITRALWFVKKLERQAAAAGGRVHFLLGNHERLALTGGSRINDRKYIELTSSLGIAYGDLFSPATELGRWIRRHGVVVRVNDTLFVHGGFAPWVVDAGMTLDDLNRVARATVDGRGAGDGALRRGAGLIWGRDGLTTYRGYFDRLSPSGIWGVLQGDLREARGAGGAVQRALERYGARRLVVGHTEARQITGLLGGRLIAICQPMPFTDFVEAASTVEMLRIEGTHVWRIGLDGRWRPL